MSTLVGTDDFVIFKNSGSIIRSALNTPSVISEVLQPFHPDDIARMKVRLEVVERAQLRKENDGEQLSTQDFGIAALSSIAGVELDDKNGAILEELMLGSVILIRSALTRKEVLLAVYETSAPRTIQNAIKNISLALNAQTLRLKESRLVSDEHMACLKEIEGVLKRYHLTFDEIIQFTDSAQSSKHIVRFVKDGIEWGGLGRRPSVYKGLSPIELEHYRVDAVAFNSERNSSTSNT